MEKVVAAFAILLPLMTCLIYWSMSNSTVTQCCQYVQMFCSLYTGVNIGRLNLLRISAGETNVLTYLESEVSDRNFDRWRTVRSWGDYHYFPRLTVVVDDQNRFLTYTESEHRTNSSHADRRLARFLNFDFGNFSATLNFTNSPCKGLARELIKVFKDRDIKPDINILWVYGKGTNPEHDAKYMNAVLSILELIRAGFKVGVWDWKDYGEYLKNNIAAACADFATKELEENMRQGAELFQMRTKITEDSLDTIKNFNVNDREKFLSKSDASTGDKSNYENDNTRNLLMYLVAVFNDYTGWQKMVAMPKAYYIVTTGAFAVLGWLVAYSGLRLTIF